VLPVLVLSGSRLSRFVEENCKLLKIRKRTRTPVEVAQIASCGFALPEHMSKPVDVYVRWHRRLPRTETVLILARHYITVSRGQTLISHWTKRSRTVVSAALGIPSTC
jgi:hypothetical protein